MSNTVHREEISLEPGPVLVTGAAGFVGYHLMKELGLGEGDIAADVTVSGPGTNIHVTGESYYSGDYRNQLDSLAPGENVPRRIAVLIRS